MKSSAALFVLVLFLSFTGTAHADFELLRANFGQGDGAGFIDGDTAGDGDVDAADYIFLKRNFGWTSPTWAVPEPASLFILAGGGLLALLRRRRRG